MKIIDGSYGEGGGQIFRTSLTLAMCLGEPVRIKNIRSGRKKPGLLRQHLTCLKAAKEICNAEISGGELGSQDVVFIPGEVRSGDFNFSVGTAGSTTLIFQTVLLPLLNATGPSKVKLSGGTHNGMAPSYEFIEASYIPLLRRIGVGLKTNLNEYGFYPAGGGSWEAEINPCKALAYLNLEYCESVSERKAVVILSRVPRHVAERELTRVTEKCGWLNESCILREVKSVGPGNVLSLQVETDGFFNVFDAYGEKNISAERVANKAIKMLQEFESAKVSAGEHLADQLLLPLLLGGGGKYTTSRPSGHLLTNIAVVEQFLPGLINIKAIDNKAYEVEISAWKKPD